MSQTQNPDPKRCSFFNKNKNRFCRFEVKPNFSFCGNHLPPPSTTATSTSNNEQETNKRIPCPLNNKHTIYEKDLKHHLKVCPDARNDPRNLPYYVKNLHGSSNSYSDANDDNDEKRKAEEELNVTSATTTATTTDAAVSIPVWDNEKVTEISHKSLSQEEHLQVWKRIVKVFREFVLPDIDLADKWVRNCLYLEQEKEVEEEKQQQQKEQEPQQIIPSTTTTTATNSKVGNRAKTGFKSVQQHQGIIRRLKQCGAICSCDADSSADVIIELGAGKAEFSLAVMDAYAADAAAAASNNENNAVVKIPHVVVVDRSNFRRKADARVAKEDENRDNNNHANNSYYKPFQRLRIDIADLDLYKISFNNSSSSNNNNNNNNNNNVDNTTTRTTTRTAVIAKHLCGAATDYAISCALKSSLSEEKRRNIMSVDFIAIATCCHHRCERKNFVLLVENIVSKHQDNNISITSTSSSNDYSNKLKKLQSCLDSLPSSVFGPLCSMSSWATCFSHQQQNSKPDDDGDNEEQEQEDTKEKKNKFEPVRRRRVVEEEKDKEQQEEDNGNNNDDDDNDEKEKLLTVSQFVSGSHLLERIPQDTKEKERAGRMCKLILDWMRANIFVLGASSSSSSSLSETQSEKKEYCFELKPFLEDAQKVTKENWLILCWRC